MLPGHVPMQVGVAVKPWVPFTGTKGDVGEILSEASTEEEDALTVMGTGLLSLLNPLRVAFTNRVSLPVLEPAVKVTDGPEVEFKAPTVFAKDHE